MDGKNPSPRGEGPRRGRASDPNGGVVRKLWYNVRHEVKTNQCCRLISRIANRAFFLNDEAKTRFVERLWCVAAFSCAEALAYRFMSNHFHILVYVPDLREMSDDELLARIRSLYSETALAEIRTSGTDPGGGDDLDRKTVRFAH